MAHSATLPILLSIARAIQFGEGAENPACVTDLKNIAVDFHIDYKKHKDEANKTTY